MTKRMTPGEAAFKKWVSLLDVPYPVTWETMPASGRAGWEDVASAAIEEYMTEDEKDLK